MLRWPLTSGTFSEDVPKIFVCLFNGAMSGGWVQVNRPNVEFIALASALVPLLWPWLAPYLGLYLPS